MENKFKNDDILFVYNDYDHNIHTKGSNGTEEFTFEARTPDGEPIYKPVPFSEIKYIARKTSLITKKKIRFEEDIEADVYKELGIRPELFANKLSRDELQDLILRFNDKALKTILQITDMNVLQTLRAEYTQLNSTYNYNIPSRCGDYIRARIEEVQQGILKSEMTGLSSLNTPDEVLETKKIEEKIKVQLELEKQAEIDEATAKVKAEATKERVKVEKEYEKKIKEMEAKIKELEGGKSTKTTAKKTTKKTTSKE